MRALEQQLVVHRDRADLRLQAPDLVVTVIGRPAVLPENVILALS